MSSNLKRGQVLTSTERFHRASHFYVRDETIDLQQLLDDAANPAEKGIIPAYVSAFCDVLNITPQAVKDGVATVQSRSNRIQTLCIYARSIELGGAVKLLNFTGVSALTLRFFFHDCPSPLRVAVQAGSAQPALNLEAELPPADPSDAAKVLSTRDAFIARNQISVAVRAQSVGREFWFRNPSDCRAVLLRNVPSLAFDYAISGASSLESEKCPLLDFCVSMFERVTTNLASSQRNIDQKLEDAKALSRLRFIAALTRNSVRSADLCSDTQLLLQCLDRPYRTIPSTTETWKGLRLDVPQMISSEDYTIVQADFREIALWENERKDILKGVQDRKLLNQVIEAINVQAAQAAKDYADIIAKLGQLHGDIISTQQSVLTAIGYAVNDYRDLDALLDDFNNATADVSKKDDDMKDANVQVKRKQAALETGIKLYEADQERKFVFSCLAAGAELALSIGAIVATAGAAAPAGVAAAADGAEKVAGAAEKFAKIKEALGKVAELILKLGSKFASDLSDWNHKEDGAASLGTKSEALVKQAAELMTKTEGQSKSLLPAEATSPLDYLGILADWEELKIDIDELFDSIAVALGGDQVDGMAEFRTALRKLVVRGETLLEARARAQTAAILYTRAFAEAVKREARKLEIDRMAKSMQNVPFQTRPVEAVRDLTIQYDQAANALRALCEEKLAHLRRVAAVDLYSYMTNIMYEQCLSSFPQQLELSSSMTNVAWAEVDKELLHVISVQQKSRSAQQSVPPLSFSTDGDEGRHFSRDWKQQLTDTGRIVCRVPDDTLETRPFYRMRMDSIKITIKDLKFRDGQALSAVSYRVVQGPLFEDRDSHGGKLQYIMNTTDEFHFTDFLDLKTWTTSTSGSRATTDEAKKYQLPTLFCPISILFSEEARQALDFQAATSISITCTAVGNSH